VISLNLVLAGLRLGLKNRQVGEKWVSDDCSCILNVIDKKWLETCRIHGIDWQQIILFGFV
jgi:hypothetical protein